MECRISGVILAGGDNKRFGGITKSNIVISGETIISRIISIISDLFDEIIIVTNTPSEFPEYLSIQNNQGSVFECRSSGWYSCCIEIIASNDAIFVFAGDMPFLKKELIAEHRSIYSIIKKYDILIPRIGTNY